MNTLEIERQEKTGYLQNQSQLNLLSLFPYSLLPAPPPDVSPSNHRRLHPPLLHRSIVFLSRSSELLMSSRLLHLTTFQASKPWRLHHLPIPPPRPPSRLLSPPPSDRLILTASLLRLLLLGRSTVLHLRVPPSLWRQIKMRFPDAVDLSGVYEHHHEVSVRSSDP